MFCLHSNGTGFPKHKRTRALLPKPLRGATALQNNGKFWPNQRRSMASWEPMGSCAPSLNHYDQNVTHAGIGSAALGKAFRGPVLQLEVNRRTLQEGLPNCVRTLLQV